MKHIIALGGGGFSMEPDNLALDRYILSQTGKPRPKVCFLPTASGDAESYQFKFYQAFVKLECQPSVLSLFRPPTGDLRDYVLDKDVIYVGGGSTRNLMILWREWALDAILREAYAAGVLLCGVSAGANCWFEQCTTDSWPGELRVMDCLGLAAGSFTPHYDGEAARRPTLHRLLREGAILPGYAADNGAAAHLLDGRLHRAVRSRPAAQLYRVTLAGGEVVEEALAMTEAGS
jgi:peptidase E